MSNYAETEKKINDIRNQYGEVLLRCGITHLMDCGFNTFVEMSDSELQQEYDAIREKYHKDVANGKIPVMTDEFQIDIIKVAKELSSLSPTDLLVYIQDNIYYDVGQNTINKQRVERIAATALDVIACELCDNDTKKFVDYCAEYEIDEEELCSLGWEKEIDTLYEQQNQDNLSVNKAINDRYRAEQEYDAFFEGQTEPDICDD